MSPSFDFVYTHTHTLFGQDEAKKFTVASKGTAQKKNFATSFYSSIKFSFATTATAHTQQMCATMILS